MIVLLYFGTKMDDMVLNVARRDINKEKYHLARTANLGHTTELFTLCFVASNGVYSLVLRVTNTLSRIECVGAHRTIENSSVSLLC